MAITRAQIPRQLEPGLGSRYNRKKVPVYNSGGTMLKGKQKKLDKDGDGKSTGRDFRMMKKARVGKMIDDTEELGRVDAEKAYTKKGKKNLKAEKKRLVKEIKKREKLVKVKC